MRRNDTRILFVGPSLMRDLYLTVLCQLQADGYHIEKGDKHGYKRVEFTHPRRGETIALLLKYSEERFLVKSEGSNARGYVLHPQEVSSSLVSGMSECHVCVVMDPSSWFSTFKLLPHNRFFRNPGPRPSGSTVDKGPIIDKATTEALHAQSIRTFIQKFGSVKDKVLWVPHVAAHFYNAATNTDDSSNSYHGTGLTRMMLGSFDKNVWKSHHPFTGFTSPTFDVPHNSAFLPDVYLNKAAHGSWFPGSTKALVESNFTIVDSFQLSSSRPDQHPCSATTNSKSDTDCLHYCAGGMYLHVAIEIQRAASSKRAP